MLRARSLLIITAAVTLLALSGCSAPTAHSASGASTKPSPSAAGQTTAEACSIMAAGAKDAMQGLQSSMSTAITDPQGALTKLDALTSALDTSLAKVSNDKVGTAFQKADDAMKSMVEQVKKMQTDPASLDATAFQASVNDVQTTFGAISDVCE